MPVYPPKFRRPFLFAVAVCLPPGRGEPADALRVAVAANFRAPMQALISLFGRSTGGTIEANYGSTGLHYSQLRNGAPYQAFFAADSTRPRLLVEEGLALEDTRFTYALGRLVLWKRGGGNGAPPEAYLKNGSFQRLAIANPALAPYGRAAREALESLGLWDAVQGSLVWGESVGQVFHFLASGNADLGFISAAQARQASGSLRDTGLRARGPSPDTRRGDRQFPSEGGGGPPHGRHDSGPASKGRGARWWPVPEELHRPLVQQAVLMRGGEKARTFLEFVAENPAARNLILEYGYALP